MRALLLGTVAAIALQVTAQAADSVPATATGTLTSDYARIAFQWPERVRFSTRSNGTQLILTFDKPTDASVDGVLASLRPIVKNAQQSEDGRSFIFTLDKPYATRTFMSGNVAGVDLLGAKKSEAPPPAETKSPQRTEQNAPKALITAKPESTKPVAPEKAAAKLPTTPSEAASKPNIVKLTKAPDSTNKPKVMEASPSAGAEIKPAQTAPSAPAAVPPTTASASASAPTATANPVTTTAAPATPTTTATPAANTVAPPASAPVSANAPAVPGVAPVTAPVAATVTAPSAPAVSVPPKSAAVPDGVQMRFAMPDRTSAAVFERGESLWIVFGRSLALDMETLKKQLPDAITQIESIPTERATVLRLQQRAPVFPHVTKVDGSHDWMVVFANRPARLEQRVRVRFNTEPPLKPHIVLPVLDASDTVTVRDPIVGDSIQVVPVFTSGLGITPERNFAELELLETAQGIAIIPRSDTTRISPQRNGLKLTASEGISLSKELPRLAMDELPDNVIAGGPTLFPYANWKLKNEGDFFKERQRLTQQMVFGPKENADFARLRLLQLYLAQGLFAEALGLANDIRNENPAFYTSEKVSAYRGAANFMMYRLQDAALDFAASEIASDAEIELWKQAIGEMQGDPTKRFDFMAYNDSYISKYPPSFRQKLAIIGGDLAINRSEFNTALKIFDTLNKDKILAPIQPYVDFMIGKVSAETGQIDTAVSLWEGLTKNLNDNFIRARAEFALVNLLLQEARITPDEAIKRLDRNRIVWRGDGLELNLLLLLGKLQLDAKNWTEGLRTYRDIVTYYPTVPEALPTAQKMAETFNFLFNQGGADTMPPLDALSLFYEFRELTPIESEGDRMIRNLADRLVSVDLLGRAAELLDHQVRYRLQREERSRTGTKLALIYLLDRKPESALQTLELTGYGQNPPELQRTRNQIAAAAYTEIKDYDSALKVLEGDQSMEGMKARLNIYWDEKNWKEVINVAESMLSNRNDPSAPLNTSEADAVLKLATAYVFQRDISQLQYLKDYFTPLMKDNKEFDTFAFITSGSEPMDYRDMNQLTQEISSIQDYLGNYRSRVQQGGLDSVVQ